MLSSAAHPLIGIDPEIRFGRAYLVGTRISVNDVLGWLGSGMSVADIIADFPELTATQIEAACAYAADCGTPYTEVLVGKPIFGLLTAYSLPKKGAATRQLIRAFVGTSAMLRKTALTLGWCIQNSLTPMGFLFQTDRLRR
ncbi:DUF433 domain-containing protein [Hymenobacter sp. BRD67]|uniref:DUF433 domain-containing protein n=1 Tax=Hymenobacter sp. BRD67 TaxID=2675877 RepID=UPI001C25D1A9|nr:DUF433 domain-containing protein [Hymenobacter sp. BRD67]